MQVSTSWEPLHAHFISNQLPHLYPVLTGVDRQFKSHSFHHVMTEYMRCCDDTWCRCSCTTPPGQGACSRLCNGLPKRFPSGWTQHTGYRLDALRVQTNTVSQHRRPTDSSNPADTMCSPLRLMLTTVWGGKLPQVQLFEGKVDIGGEFAGSDVGFWESLQVWGGHWVKEPRLRFNKGLRIHSKANEIHWQIGPPNTVSC